MDLPSPLTVLDLPSALLGCALNGPALSNEDRARAARSCKTLREAVKFRDIVLRSGGTGRAAVEAALASACGFCESLDGADAVVHATTLGEIGATRPELVARLRRVRVWWADLVRPPPLPRATFPALHTIELQVLRERQRDPPDMVPPDARVVLDRVVVSGFDPDACTRLARMPRPPQCMDLFTRQSVEDVERARDAGLRVDTLSINVCDSHTDRARFAAAAVPLATGTLICPVLDGALVVRHLDPRVAAIALSLTPGTMEALDTTGCKLRLLRLHHPSHRLREADVAAFERLLARGAVAELDWTVRILDVDVDVTTWTRILIAASRAPPMHTLRLNISLNNAIALFSTVSPSATHLILQSIVTGPDNSRQLLADRFAALGASLGQWRGLRSFSFQYYYPIDAFCALVNALVAANPTVERVAMLGGRWTPDGGFAF